MSNSRIYIVYDFDEKGAPINVQLWWRQPPRFFYDSKIVTPDYFSHNKLVLAVVEINDGGTKKYDFAYLAPSLELAKYKYNSYVNNNIQGTDKTLINVSYLTLDVNG